MVAKSLDCLLVFEVVRAFYAAMLLLRCLNWLSCQGVLIACWTVAKMFILAVRLFPWGCCGL